MIIQPKFLIPLLLTIFNNKIHIPSNAGASPIKTDQSFPPAIHAIQAGINATRQRRSRPPQSLHCQLLPFIVTYRYIYQQNRFTPPPHKHQATHLPQTTGTRHKGKAANRVQAMPSPASGTSPFIAQQGLMKTLGRIRPPVLSSSVLFNPIPSISPCTFTSARHRPNISILVILSNRYPFNFSNPCKND